MKTKDFISEVFILLALAFVISLPLLMARQLTIPLTYIPAAEIQK
jgi:hypothetical protein